MSWMSHTHRHCACGCPGRRHKQCRLSCLCHRKNPGHNTCCIDSDYVLNGPLTMLPSAVRQNDGAWAHSTCERMSGHYNMKRCRLSSEFHEISWNLMWPKSRVAWSMRVRMEVPSQSHDMTVQMRYTRKKHCIPARETTSKAGVWSGGK